MFPDHVQRDVMLLKPGEWFTMMGEVRRSTCLQCCAPRIGLVCFLMNDG